MSNTRTRRKIIHVTRSPVGKKAAHAIAREWRDGGFKNVRIVVDTVHGYADPATFAKWLAIEARRDVKQ